MSSLFSLLDLGAGAISAKSTGVAVAGNNAANADTEGYSRQRVDFRSERGFPVAGGVRAGAVQRFESLLLAGRSRVGGAALAMSRAFTQALTDFEIATSASNVAGKMSEFFAAVGSVSASPLDPFARPAAVTAAENLAKSIRSQATAVAEARSETDQRIRERTREASALAQQVADLNKATQISSDPVVADKRDAAAQNLAELVGGRARIDSDGYMRVVLDNGGVLVDGANAATLEANTDSANDGMARIELVDGPHRLDITSNLSAGTIGGEIAFRDGTAKTTIGDLDQLAFDLATSINATHRANIGADGIGGRDLFVEPTVVTGAATALAVDSAVLADADLFATGQAGGGPGDNRGALALLGLRDQPLASGGTRSFIDAGIDLVANVGYEAANSTAQLDRLSATVDHLDGLRDSLAGVSVQEELTRLSEFQRGIEAASRFVSTVDDILGTIINTL